MAQRKAPPTSRSSSASSAKQSGARSTTRGQTGTATRPPAKKPGKSIVNQRQTPWGLIIATVLVVVFAVGIVGYAVTRKSASSTAYLNELADAKSISGVTFTKEPDRGHVTGTVAYNTTPPVGGNHNGYWADCTGTVYPNPIANENAVHMLEHGAVWITYQPGLAKTEVDALTKMVNGVDRMAMSPYPGLKSKISLQSWGYQLFVDSASDPRIQQFVDALRYNPKTTPEYGADCSQPTFKTKPSTFGNPLNGPAQ